MGRGRWVSAAVTVDVDPAELRDSPALDPVRALGGQVETTLVAGPGAWGTELHVRRLTTDAPDEAVGDLQRAVRDVRQLAETGEVLRLEPRPAGRRRRTPGGALVDWAEAHSGRFVVLRRRWSTRP